MPIRRRRPTTLIPRYLKPYFWDSDFASINARRHSKYVIERVLEYGDDRAIRWLRKHYTPAQIGKVVRSSRVLAPNTANLWSLLLSIPRSEIQCFSKLSPFLHSNFSKN